jgi:hypothetical protein
MDPPHLQQPLQICFLHDFFLTFLLAKLQSGFGFVVFVISSEHIGGSEGGGGKHSPPHSQQPLHVILLQDFVLIFLVANLQVLMHCGGIAGGAGGGDAQRDLLHAQQLFLQIFFLHCFFHALAFFAEQPQTGEGGDAAAGRSKRSATVFI